MDQIHVREGNSEVLIYIDKWKATPLSALEEAAKILAREIIRVKTDSPTYRTNDSNII